MPFGVEFGKPELEAWRPLRPGLNRLRKETAVHAQIDSRYKRTGFVTGQEQTRPHEFKRLPKSRHRRMPPNRFRPRRRRAVVIEKELTVLLGGKEARRD